MVFKGKDKLKFKPANVREFYEWIDESSECANIFHQKFMIEKGGQTRMANLNPSFSSVKRADHFRARIHKLEELGQSQADTKAWEMYDSETEKLLAQTFGPAHRYVEAYKYAMLGEAEALVNMPEGAQEASNQDLPQKAIQQRRQLLHAIVADLENLEKIEEEALTGEDHEDPPSLT